MEEWRRRRYSDQESEIILALGVNHLKVKDGQEQETFLHSLTPVPNAADTLHQEGVLLWIPLRKEWRDVTTKPEEIVRQKFIRTLVEHYGYTLGQMDQERRTQARPQEPSRRHRDLAVSHREGSWAQAQLVIKSKTEHHRDIRNATITKAESYTRATGWVSSSLPPMPGTRLFSSSYPACPGDSLPSMKSPKPRTGVTPNG